MPLTHARKRRSHFRRPLYHHLLSYALANKPGLDWGKSAAKDIKYAQETVDAWLDGMTTAISNAQKRKAQAQQKQEAKQETTTAQKAEQEAEQGTRNGTVQDLELALEVARKDVKGWDAHVEWDKKNGFPTETSRALLAKSVQRARLIENMLAKARKGDVLSSEELATLDSFYDEQLNYKYLAKDWKAFREQGQKAETKVSYSQNDNISTGIKQQLQNHLDELNAMEPVVTINSKEYSFKNKTDLRKQITQEFKQSGVVVDRQGFGEVVFDEEAVGQIVSYISDSDIGGLLAIKAAPAVVKRGKEIDYQKNYKNRGFDTVTFAAPVKINGTRGNVAVVVRMIKNNRAHCVRIVLPDGSAFKIDSKKADAILGSGLDTQVQKRNGSAHENSVPQPTQNVNGKFSLNDAVEETRDLIAVHNVSEKNLLKMLKLGGFPAVSIAITKAENGWSPFGDISVVFGKETIDPEPSADNHVYGGDTWTPTFPRVYNNASSNTLSLKNYLVPNGTFFGKKLQDSLDRDLYHDRISAADFLDKYRHDASMMQAFHLFTEGSPLPVVFEKKRAQHVDSKEYDAIEKLFVDVLGKKKAKRVFTAGAVNGYQLLTDAEADRIIDAARQTGYISAFDAASDDAYILKSIKALQRPVDVQASERTIKQATNAHEYEEWLKTYHTMSVDGYFRTENGKPLPVTADNAVELMKEGARVGAGGNVADPYIMLAKEYASIDDIRQGKDVIGKHPVERNPNVWARYRRVLDQIFDNNEVFGSGSEQSAGYKFARKIASVLRKSEEGSSMQQTEKLWEDLETATGLQISVEQVEELVNIRDAVWSTEKSLFEAKPMRNMPLSEAKLVIVPEGTSQELLDALNDNNIPVETYEAGNEQARLNLLNGATAQKYMFATDDLGLPDGHYDYSKSFAEQIEDYKAGKFPERDTFILGGTPDIYQKIGLSALPMTMDQTHVDYALNGTKNADHQLGEELLKQLPDLIKKPVAIIESATRPNDSAIVIVRGKVNEHQLMAAVHVGDVGKQNKIDIDSNHVASTQGRKNTVTKLLKDAVEKEANGETAVYYWNKTEALSLAVESGLQLPGAHISDGLLHSIFDAGSPVNRKYLEQTETRQFKNWFGRSVVRNADGTPEKVYHGTAAYFTVFERGDIGYHVGTKAQAEDRIAGVEGGHVMELYASIQNPLYAAMDFGDWHGQNVAEMLIETEQFEDFDNRAEIEERLSEIAQMENQQEADMALRTC